VRLDGGLTTVNETTSAAGTRTLVLVANGQVLGAAIEAKARRRRALYPLLHTTGRDEALVVGLGTGVSAATVRAAGFGHVDVVEPSHDVADLAAAHFAEARVLREPGVDLHVADGRHFLLLTTKTYDLVSIEVASIWFAGNSALYSREFYELAKSRLRPGGVLEQKCSFTAWEATTSFRFSPRCDRSFRASRSIHRLAGDHRRVRSGLRALPRDARRHTGRPEPLLEDRLLSPESVDRFLADVATRGLGTRRARVDRR